VYQGCTRIVLLDRSLKRILRCWTSYAYKLENGLLKLVESLEKKKLDGDWIDSLIVKELNEEYGKVE